MGKAINKEKKEMIIHAREIGKNVKEICELYMVKKSAVYELYKRYEETKEIGEPKKASGRPARISEEKLGMIKERLKEKNDITLQELIEELSLGVCKSALSRTLRTKLNSNYKKKTLYPKEQERDDVKKSGRNGAKANRKWT